MLQPVKKSITSLQIFFLCGSKRVLPGTSFDSNGIAIETKGYILRKENLVEKSYNLYETIGGSLSQLLYKMKHPFLNPRRKTIILVFSL
jgi:hypothetical protein